VKLVVGLGNPGPEHAHTRHNLGWDALDAYIDKKPLKWAENAKFGAFIAREGKNIFLKPTKFYNLTGEVVAAVARYYKIPVSNILAVYDESALPIGTLRTRLGGSDAGNNGVKSMITHLGPDFARLRIGSGRATITNHTKHVLSKPNLLERRKIKALGPQIHQLIDGFLEDNFPITSVK
jgi:PTH1 family peptidyl-tRNA hydrolase